MSGDNIRKGTCGVCKRPAEQIAMVRTYHKAREFYVGEKCTVATYGLDFPPLMFIPDAA